MDVIDERHFVRFVLKMNFAVRVYNAVNIMAADNLATQEARSSVAMVLTTQQQPP